MRRKPKKYGNNPPYVAKDNDAIAANFPNPNATLLSPAFTSPETVPSAFANGLSGPTDDCVLEQFLQNLETRNSWLKNYVLKSEEGRNIPYVIVSSAPSNSTHRDPNKLRVWIQAATHGDEPASEQSVLALLGKLDVDKTWTTSLLDRLELLIVPRYNPDGVAYFQRRFATNFDPARDHIKLRSQQTRDIKSLYCSFAPHIAVDMHEFSAKARYAKRYAPASDGQFAVAKNLNIHADIRRLSEELFVRSIASGMDAARLRWSPYAVGNSNASRDESVKFAEAGSGACIARNAWGLTQAVSILSETRGIGIADQHFARRTFTGLIILQTIVETAILHADNIRSVIEHARQEFTNSRGDIIVTDARETTGRTWPLIDINSGLLVDVPIVFESSTPIKPTLVRARPKAYLIPKAWYELVERLASNGVEVQTLDHVFGGNVEIFKIKSVQFDNEYYEGALRASITTEATSRYLEAPAGSYLVSTTQRHAGLAFMALEPESVDSFATFNIIPLVPGDEYPIFRVLWD